jgi:DNA-binding transcriptional LysR family regulator
MEHHQLLNFLAVCEEMSFSGAAKRRFLTQQALSSSIKSLENELDVPLFYRKGRSLELSEYGRALREDITSYMNHHDVVVERIHRIKDSSKEIVTVSIRTGLAQHLPENFFINFMNGHPESHLRLHSFGVNECQKIMLEHNIHTGFVTEPVDHTIFDSFELTRNKVALAAGKQHPLAKRESVKLSELKDESVAIYDDGVSPQNRLLNLCLQNGIVPDFYFAGFEHGLFKEFCSANKIVAFADKAMARSLGLVSITIEDADLEWHVNFLVRKNIQLNNAEKAFVEYTKSILKIG